MYLCNSKITQSDVEEIFQKYSNNTNAKLAKVEGDVIGKGLGFLSDVMRLDLTWNTNDLPTRVIVKAPKIDHLNEITDKTGGPKFEDDFVTSGHNRECKAFEILKQEYPIAIPKIYGCRPIDESHAGFIVMEDIGQQAGLAGNIAEGVTLEQWKNIVLSLADLHAWSLTTKVRWREDIPKMEDMRSMFTFFAETITFAIGKIHEDYPAYFADINAAAVLKEIDVDRMMQNQAKYRTIVDDVMQHGDTWVNNIMFYKNADGSIGDRVAALLDWQMTVQGCGVNDLTRFETWCVNHNMRRNHYKEILRLYYDRLTSKAGGKVKATYEQIEAIYKESFLYHGLSYVADIDGMLKSVVRIEEDKSGWRQEEMLQRARAIYEDAPSFGACL